MCKIEILKSNDVPKFQNNYNMNSKELINKIIPPHNYSTDGFNNIPQIENLNIGEKKLLENELINQLKLDLKHKIQTNTLIVETLTYLKSIKSLPTLY